jgi:hypothetical protein
MFTKGWFAAILFFYSFSVVAQSVRFSEFYDLNQGAGGFVDVALVDNERLIAVGSVLNLSDNVNFYNGFHVVVSLSGNQLASQGFNPIGMNYNTRSVIQSTFREATFSGGYFCDFTVESPGYCDFFFSRINSNTGDTTFTRIIQRTDTADVFLNMVETRPNKIMLIGWTYDDTTDADADLLFITVDTLGNELNRVVYGGGGTDYVHSGTVINELGEIMMTGGTKSFAGGDYDTWVLKTDSIGNVQWQQTYNHLSPSGGDGGTKLIPTVDGNFVVVGAYDDLSIPASYAFMMKIDPDGNEIWTKRYENEFSQGFWACEGLSDGSIVAVGQTSNTGEGSQGQGGWIVKTDSNGDTLWTRTYNPSSSSDLFRNMLVMPNGDIVAVGFGRGENSTTQDGWILRVDSMGCLEEGCWSVGIEELEEETRYFKAYPNPFTHQVTIEYDLSEDCIDGCFIRMMDISGRIVYEKAIISGEGPNSVTLDMGKYETGMYICSLYNNQRLLQTSRLVRIE